MSRTARASRGNYCYHVLNRGNARSTVFQGDDDYQEFVDLLGEASLFREMRVLAYCLMPDHFHLVLRPIHDGDLSSWMQWLATAHVRRYHRRHESSGHVWQGRFKAFPIQEDEHLTAILRYVEGNPLRSKLVDRSQDWYWSSLNRPAAAAENAVRLDSGPVPRGNGWTNRVNRPMPGGELAAIRQCVVRGAPFGTDAWSRKTAVALGLEASLRPRGRPRTRPAD